MTIGGLSRGELIVALASRGVLLNAHAEALLANSIFDGRSEERDILIRELTVADLGLAGGASLSQIFQEAHDQGLLLYSPDTAPYLRLALIEQASAPDTIMSSGSAPSSSITVASRIIRDDDDFPKGFYLRVVDGQPWLRGYLCDDEHLWLPNDLFAFQVPS